MNLPITLIRESNVYSTLGGTYCPYGTPTPPWPPCACHFPFFFILLLIFIVPILYTPSRLVLIVSYLVVDWSMMPDVLEYRVA